jgi:hypothetical protein
LGPSFGFHDLASRSCSGKQLTTKMPVAAKAYLSGGTPIALIHRSAVPSRTESVARHWIPACTG